MSYLKFKVGDVVADDLGIIGTILGVYPGEPFPYAVRENDGRTGRHAQTDRMRLADTEPLTTPDPVEHPPHYGGADDPYEAIKVIEAWGLGFHLGNTVKYISRAGKKTGQSLLQDLKKARWYIDRLIQKIEKGESPWDAN